MCSFALIDNLDCLDNSIELYSSHQDKTIMLIRPSLLLIWPVFFIFMFTHVAMADSCESKINNIQKQIDYAKKHNNTHRVTGLITAQKEITAHCNKSSLVAKQQQKITQKKQKVIERQHQLAVAEQTDDTDNILKKRKKLSKAEEELSAHSKAP